MATTSAQSIRKYTGPALLERGFRPFFLGAAIFAGLAIPAWILALSAGASLSPYLTARELHVHEMVFGYPSAVIAGFLLTATPNWTGRLPVIGMSLAGLFVLWLAGRIAMVTPLPWPYAAAIIDSLFLIVFAGLLWREILAAGNVRNMPVCVLVSLIAAANIAFHVLTITGAETDLAVRGALGLIALMITLIGGRIVPSFTRNWLVKKEITSLPAQFSRFDQIALLSGVVAVGCWITLPAAKITGVLALLAGVLHFIRLSRWRGWTTFSEPLVTILHIGYLWLPVWLLLLSASILGDGILSASTTTHALTTGAIGTMTIAVMSRAILGHSDRPLHAGPGTAAIYALIVTGAAVRVVSETLPLEYVGGMALSGAIWSAGYVLFIWIYGPMCLIRRKPVRA